MKKVLTIHVCRRDFEGKFLEFETTADRGQCCGTGRTASESVFQLFKHLNCAPSIKKSLEAAA